MLRIPGARIVSADLSQFKDFRVTLRLLAALSCIAISAGSASAQEGKGTRIVGKLSPQLLEVLRGPLSKTPRLEFTAEFKVPAERQTKVVCATDIHAGAVICEDETVYVRCPTSVELFVPGLDPSPTAAITCVPNTPAADGTCECEFS